MTAVIRSGESRADHAAFAVAGSPEHGRDRRP